MNQKFDAYVRLMRMDRPIGTLLLLWPCLMSLWLASDGIPQWHLLVIFILGVVVMRACGCVINDFADRKVDGKIERTKGRPLATGEVSSREALGLFGVLTFIAFTLVLFLNKTVILLSVVGIIFTTLYPFMKRWTHLPQVFLGITWSLSIPMAYAAVNEQLPVIAWWLYFGNLFWTIAYDTMYGMVDREDDLKAGVKSTAILFGRFDTQIIGFFQFLALACFTMAGLSHDRGVAYIVGMLMFVGFAIYQQNLIKRKQRQDCFKAFLNNNRVGAIIFACLVIDYYF
ncbi:4-hydroxybenzoate octaprenyltransferase [Shewanella sp. 202IG2-18]|uniref:4-hydroxybenzoate octaprenyltransferase n=1 Tax=Parashewanella hymeniacidonis TaxID=2807618 RepID=UPI0019615A22|nr:4-hydroxybenzoate octaprenyltransferase [Parashewanella hymeniacidonis]MBM7074296.1 4-hydroxybenzoate octaprenyltransferase [Parashewanella hymeniacidonis]